MNNKLNIKLEQAKELLLFAKNKLEWIKDEGPDGEGWQSKELIKFFNEYENWIKSLNS